MKAKFCVATNKKFTDFDAAMVYIRGIVAPAKLLGYTINDGDGCYNHGIMLEHEEEELRDLGIMKMSYVLMPAKYWPVSSSDPGVEEGMFHGQVKKAV